ncbi:MAG: cation:proton antiporter [Planctomycetota bacterium]|jgi:CPA2 family monovalent cation:H+ antiporter-2
METWTVLLDLLILLTAALVLGTVAERLRQSAVLGYLVAGTVVGPNVMGLVGTGGTVEQIAELGVALLLFTIGLEFSLTRLRRMGHVALVGGSLQVIVTMLAGAAVAGLLAPAIGLRGALAVGAIVALSSTACVIRVLLDRAALDSLYGRGSIGILLIQDISVIPLIVMMVVLSGGGTPGQAAIVLLRTAALGIGLFGALYIVLNFIVPRLMNIERWASNRELPILLAIVIALGSAAAAHEASISPAMGAFVAGVLLGESPFAAQIRADVASLRTLLVTLFFASIGMLGDPAWALGNWHLVTGAVLAIVAGKTLIVWAIYRMLGQAHGLALATGLCVAQVGEFSFVLTEMAHDGGLLSDRIFRLAVSVTLVTLFATPFLVAVAPRLGGWIESRRTRRQAAAPEAPAAAPEAAAVSGPPTEEGGVLIVGFGPAGQAVVESLHGRHAAGIEVIDLNPRNVAIARRYGVDAHVGDASHRDVLEHVGARRARAIVITIPAPDAARTIVHLCRDLAPAAKILVRARYHVRRWELQLAGAHEVVDEEEQVGRRLAARLRAIQRERPAPGT